MLRVMPYVFLGVVQGEPDSYCCVLGETGYLAMFAVVSGMMAARLNVVSSQAVDTGAIMIGDIGNMWTVLVARQVVRMNYLTSRLHRKGSYRSTIWCRRDDQDD